MPPGVALRGAQQVDVNPLITASGPHAGPFNLNSAMLGGTPLAECIWERSQISPVPQGVTTTGISDPSVPPLTTAQYIHRREFLIKRELERTGSDAPPMKKKEKKKRAVTSRLAPLTDPRVDPFLADMLFSDVSPTIRACVEARYDDTRMRTFLARAFSNRCAKHETLAKDTRNLVEFLSFLRN